MFTELRLIQIQRFNYVIFTICALSLTVSASLEYIIIINRLRKIEVSFNPSPAQITSFIYWILTARNFSAAIVDTLRLYQRKQEIESGKSKKSLIPNIRIFLGSWLLFLGALSIAIGAQERVNQEAEIVIV